MRWFFFLFVLPLSLFSIDFPAWMVDQIRKDYAKLKPYDLQQEKMEAFMRAWTGAPGFIYYQIRGNQFHFESFLPEGHPRVEMMNQSMRELLSCYTLPDLDCIVCVEDSVDRANLSVPCFAFAKNDDLKEKVILIPDFEALQQGEQFLSQVEEGIAKYPWKKKKAKAFWRGSATGGVFNQDTFTNFPRSQLVFQSLLHPKLIDAKLVYPLVQSNDPQKVTAIFSNYFISKLTPITHHIKYKYQILADGNTCAYSRAYWQFFSGCPIFKHSSPNIQWYYGALIPGIHYIPCNADFSDLPQKIEWAKKHDREMQQVGVNAREFAKKNLKKEAVYKYLYLTLSEYAKMQEMN